MTSKEQRENHAKIISLREKAAKNSLPSIHKVRELDDTPVSYRIATGDGEGLMTMNGNLLVSAYRKAGKTSLILDLAIALTSDQPFLGRLDCKALNGPLLYANLELNQNMLRQYCEQLGISPMNDMLLVQDWRGMSTQFNLADPEWREMYTDQLYDLGAKALIIDPIHPLLVSSGTDSNSNDESRRVVELLGEIARFAQLDHLIIVDHTGHADKTRARGASGKEDWADILWNLSTDDSGGQYRTLNVTGRGASGSQRYMMRDHKLVLSRPTGDDQSGKAQVMVDILAFMRKEDRAVTVTAIGAATGIAQPRISEALNTSISVERLPQKQGKAELWRIVGGF